MQMKYEGFAKRFVQMCAENNFSTKGEELSKIFNVSVPMISYYKNGHKIPEMDNAIAMAEIFGCTVEWLLTGRGDKYPIKLTEDFIDISSLSPEEKASFKTLFHSISQQKTAKKTVNGN